MDRKFSYLVLCVGLGSLTACLPPSDQAGLSAALNHAGVSPVDVDPACGSASGQSFSLKPASKLCASGTPSSVSGSGPWYWDCAGTSSSVSCSADESVISGECGTADGGTYSSKPTVNLCTLGSASAVSGSGPWVWTCGGSASCSASSASSSDPSTELETQPVYRYVNAYLAMHIFTLSSSIPGPGFYLESTAFETYTASAGSEMKELFRCNNEDAVHFLASESNCRFNGSTNVRNEGSVGFIYKTEQTGTTALYQVCSATDCIQTTSAAEKDYLVLSHIYNAIPWNILGYVPN